MRIGVNKNRQNDKGPFAHILINKSCEIKNFSGLNWHNRRELVNQKIQLKIERMDEHGWASHVEYRTKWWRSLNLTEKLRNMGNRPT